MQVDKVPDLPRQLSYSLKLIIYRRPFEQTGPTRPKGFRLRDAEFRLHMEYLASIDLRTLIFGLNARIDGR